MSETTVSFGDGSVTLIVPGSGMAAGRVLRLFLTRDQYQRLLDRLGAEGIKRLVTVLTPGGLLGVPRMPDGSPVTHFLFGTDARIEVGRPADRVIDARPEAVRIGSKAVERRSGGHRVRSLNKGRIAFRVCEYVEIVRPDGTVDAFPADSEVGRLFLAKAGA